MRVLVFIIGLISGLRDASYNNVVLNRFDLFHDSFQVPQQNMKSGSNLTRGFHLHWPACRTPRQPPMIINSWEAPYIATKRREGKERNNIYTESYRKPFNWASKQKQKQYFVRGGAHQRFIILTGNMQVSPPKLRFPSWSLGVWNPSYSSRDFSSQTLLIC